MDADAEIAKAQAKLAKAVEGAKRQKKILEDPAYREKVGEELQEVERRKLRDFESECREFEGSIAQFEELKLGD